MEIDQEEIASLDHLDIDTVAALYNEAKHVEDDAIAYRRQIGAEIARRMAVADTFGGRATGRTDQHKITVQFDSTVKIDNLEQLKASIPEAVFNNLVKTKYEASASYLKYLRGNEPDMYAAIAQYVTSKPRSPQIEIAAA